MPDSTVILGTQKEDGLLRPNELKAQATPYTSHTDHPVTTHIFATLHCFSIVAQLIARDLEALYNGSGV